MIVCPSCRAEIPDDSFFCDQCGRALKFCPSCGKPRRGTQCAACGEDLVDASQFFNSSCNGQKLFLCGENLRLEIKEGEFGRAGGIYPEFASCPYISGRHGMFCKDSSGWAIMDFGSTNGTFIGGKKLEPNVKYPLAKGARLKIATSEFTIE